MSDASLPVPSHTRSRLWAVLEFPTLLAVVAAPPLLLTLIISTLLEHNAHQMKLTLHERYMVLRARLEATTEPRREVELGPWTLQALPEEQQAVLLAAGWFSASEETGWYPPFSWDHIQHLRSQRRLLRQELSEIVSTSEAQFGRRPEDLFSSVNPTPR
jgi:hypothetical protein